MKEVNKKLDNLSTKKRTENEIIVEELKSI